MNPFAAEMLLWAEAESCRPAWIAWWHGDRDPAVKAKAKVYARYITGGAS